MSKKKTAKANKALTMNTRQVVAAIRTISESLGVNPSEIKMRELNEMGLSERQIKRQGGLAAIKKAHFPQEDKSHGEIRELKNQSRYIAQLEKQLGSQEVFESKIKEALATIKPIKIAPYQMRKKTPIKRAISAVLSDLHIGSDVKKEETGKLDFGKVEESRRLARIVQEIIEYKPHYRNETELNLLIIGDVIENKLHDLGDDSAPVAEQAARAIHLLTQAVAHLANKFPKVNVKFQTGNHGRNTGRHHGRAVSQKWDSIETIIYYAIKTALQNHKNVNFDLPLTPYLIYEVFGKKIFVTHGDSVLNVGYPGSAIKTGSLEDQINRINASLPDAEEIAAFVVGHVHVGSMTYLSNGAVLITNGPLVPSNAFAVSIGLMEAACGQYLFESVPGYPVGDSRYIRVSEVDDKNPQLDKLIQPWEKL
jgi:hypothetical protein